MARWRDGFFYKERKRKRDYIENENSEMARWRDGEMARWRDGEMDFFYKERKRKRDYMENVSQESFVPS